MTTTTVSIGSRTTTVDTETPAGSSGGGPLYVVTFGTTPSGIAVGDMGFMDTQDAGGGSASDYEFVVTAISGADITLKYLRDTGSKGDHSPLGLYTGAGSSGSPTQAAMVFKRHGLPTSSADGAAPSYVVTFSDAGPPADSDVGDIAFVAGASANFEYLITAIDLSAKTATMKYLTGSGQTSPYGIAGSGGTQAVLQFKRAFSTITLFEAMIDDSSPAYWGTSDDVVGECHADSPFTDDSRVQFADKQSLASVKLTVHEDDRHDGTAGSGVVIRPTAYAGAANGVIEPNIDNFIMEWIEIDLSGTNTTKGIWFKGTNDDNIIRNNIIHSRTGSPTSDPIFAIHMAGASSASSDTISILNNIVYDFRETADDGAAGININGWKGIANIYNNTVHNIESDNSGSTKTAICFRFNGQATQVANVKNNIASLLIADTAAEHRAYWDTGTGTSNVDYNLSDDTTNSTYEAQGANSLKDKTAAQIDFVGVVAGSEDLHLDTDSVCREAGVDLGTTNGVNIDIDQVDRDATGVTWDMGADQASTAATGNPAFLMFVD
ncbi:hypothetical protein OAA46_00290 [bacterium]|nr:hypothetical protein [bacterium]